MPQFSYLAELVDPAHMMPADALIKGCRFSPCLMNATG
jgi:hypothetical protein